jgi:hypothetical protein
VPTYTAALAQRLIWLPVAYQAIVEAHEGLSVKPDPRSFHHDLTRQCASRADTARLPGILIAGDSTRRQSAQITINPRDPTVSRTSPEPRSDNGCLNMRCIALAAVTALAVGAAVTAHA